MGDSAIKNREFEGRLLYFNISSNMNSTAGRVPFYPLLTKGNE